MSRLRLCPLRDTLQKDMFQYKELETCSQVFLRQITIAPSLTAPYDVPYKVFSRSDRVIKIPMKGKVETVTVDLVKPAHFEREPETGNTTQRQTNPKPKSTAPKSAAIARKPRMNRARSSSSNTPKSFRTGVNTNMSTKTRSLTLRVDTSLQSLYSLAGTVGVFKRTHAYPTLTFAK